MLPTGQNGQICPFSPVKVTPWGNSAPQKLSSTTFPHLITTPCGRCRGLIHDAGEATQLQLRAARQGVKVLGSYLCARGGVTLLRLPRRAVAG